MGLARSRRLLVVAHLELCQRLTFTHAGSSLPPQSCPESGAASPRSLDDDDDTDVKDKELTTEALLCAFDTLGKAWPRNPETQGQLQFVLREDTNGPPLTLKRVQQLRKKLRRL